MHSRPPHPLCEGKPSQTPRRPRGAPVPVVRIPARTAHPPGYIAQADIQKPNPLRPGQSIRAEGSFRQIGGGRCVGDILITLVVFSFLEHRFSSHYVKDLFSSSH